MSPPTPDQILGWAKVILDQFGGTAAIMVILFIGAASYVYNKFISRD